MSSPDTKMTALDPLPAGWQTSARAVLVVYAGDTRGGASTRVVEIPDGTQLTVGRAKDATIVVDSDRVSRIHARITRRGNDVTIEDAGSRNGTWVNGGAISGPRALRSGDEIVVGPVTCVVTLTSRLHAGVRVEPIRRLDETLIAEVDRGKRFQRQFSLLMLHMTGEQAQIDAAVDRIATRLRPMDLLAEYAPLEYAIVLPELDAKTVAPLAREIVVAARTYDGQPVPLEVTAGLAAFPEHGTTPGTLISRARAAMASPAAVATARGSGSGRAPTIGTPPEEQSSTGASVVLEDPQMRRVYELVHKVAKHPITVLVCGETGVGKEVVASAIHRESDRSSGPLVRLNCASLPETLLESALFGHEKGAFTGADKRTRGHFEAAHGGTLFLDEIGETSPGTQAKLLRVLESRRFTRVGGTEELEVDVRVVCATNRDLEAESRRGTFRSDLFFRISAFAILIPPLRDRPGEIHLLAQHFMREASRGARVPTLADDAAEALRAYPWPGNVRELRNAIERAIVLHSDGSIEIEDLPDAVRDYRRIALPAALASAAVAGATFSPSSEALERAAIVKALEDCHGSQTEAAKRLGLTRRTLIYRMEKHGLKPPPASRG
jgi:DNA-binding NtrC family response regulator